MTNPFSARPITVPPEASLAAVTAWHKRQYGLIGERMKRVLSAGAPALLRYELQQVLTDIHAAWTEHESDPVHIVAVLEDRIMQLTELEGVAP